MPQDYDCRTRDWYQKAANNRDKAVWTDPYLDAGEIGGYVVTVAKAVENDGNLVGAIGLDIKLSRFSDIVNDIIYGEKGTLMLVNSSGEIFSHPDSNMLMTNIKEDEELSSHLISGDGTSIFYYKGVEHVMSYMTIPETGWKLIGMIPLDVNQTLAPITARQYK